ncbi:uncharacterized protein LOC116544453 [Sapajus apella]|uniref:Uncharacterized protein LOC116544453 n=1 Tax=Sapajus apella TaxID=9515 RepID=A0A6J3H894_SAPAP|nr:uncharacterized protein LOC116544453 [Sapajus apella]
MGLQVVFSFCCLQSRLQHISTNLWIPRKEVFSISQEQNCPVESQSTVVAEKREVTDEEHGRHREKDKYAELCCVSVSSFYSSKTWRSQDLMSSRPPDEGSAHPESQLDSPLVCNCTATASGGLVLHFWNHLSWSWWLLLHCPSEVGEIGCSQPPLKGNKRLVRLMERTSCSTVHTPCPKLVVRTSCSKEVEEQKGKVSKSVQAQKPTISVLGLTYAHYNNRNTSLSVKLRC